MALASKQSRLVSRPTWHAPGHKYAQVGSSVYGLHWAPHRADGQQQSGKRQYSLCASQIEAREVEHEVLLMPAVEEHTGRVRSRV